MLLSCERKAHSVIVALEGWSFEITSNGIFLEQKNLCPDPKVWGRLKYFRILTHLCDNHKSPFTKTPPKSDLYLSSLKLLMVWRDGLWCLQLEHSGSSFLCSRLQHACMVLGRRKTLTEHRIIDFKKKNPDTIFNNVELWHIPMIDPQFCAQEYCELFKNPPKKFLIIISQSCPH